MKRIALAFLLAGSAGSAHAQSVKPDLSGVSFLVGDWSSGKGEVAGAGGTSTGSSCITVAANGAVLLRQDHTNLFDKTGKATGSFDQIMLIYPEGGGLRGDYSDGTHVIHYTQADVDPGKSVAFTSANQPGAPVFKLTYALTKPDILSVTFAMAPPGATTFNPIATGTLHKGG